MLSTTRDMEAAERCFRKVLQASHTTPPPVITVDKRAAYPPAFTGLRHDGSLPVTCMLRQCNTSSLESWCILLKGMRQDSERL